MAATNGFNFISFFSADRGQATNLSAKPWRKSTQNVTMGSG